MKTTTKTRRGFTLVELLTVISIISILITLLLPAIQKAREAANRMTCSSNMRQVGIALHGYSLARGKFPAAGAGFDSFGNFTIGTTSTLTSLLPYIEQDTVYQQFDLTQPYNATPTNRAAAKNLEKTYLCPTNPIRRSDGFDSLGYGMTDYMPVSGTFIDPASTPAVLLKLPAIGSTDVGLFRMPAAGPEVALDGLSKTICMVEAVGRSEFFFTPTFTDPIGTDLLGPGNNKRNSFRWAEPVSTSTVSGPPPAAFKGKVINNSSSPLGGPLNCNWTVGDCGPNEEPFSFHGGGCNCLFADGHVSFIRDDIDPVTLRRLVTSVEGLPIPGGVDY